MANSKIIIVEGAQGAGKTTVTDYIRHSLKHTNLYRLSGTSDVTPEGKFKAKEMYVDLLDYMKKLENKDINLLFDRTFFSEENYCRLGKKQYSFTDVYEKLVEKLNELDFEIYYINIFLEDVSIFGKRLQREGKAVPEYAKFEVENSIKQQEIYLQMAKELQEKFQKIKVKNIENSKDFEDIKKEIREFVGY